MSIVVYGGSSGCRAKAIFYLLRGRGIAGCSILTSNDFEELLPYELDEMQNVAGPCDLGSRKDKTYLLAGSHRLCLR